MAFSPMFTPVDDRNNPIGGALTRVVPAGEGTTVIKALPGRLCTVIVTAAGTGAAGDAGTGFYDSPADDTGTPLFVVPGDAAVGTIFQVGAPALLGLTAVGVALSPAMTVVYS